MASAAILSLEDVRDAQRRTEGRPHLHDRFDAWLNQLEARRAARTPTLEALPPAVLTLRQELTPAVTEGVVAHAPRAALEQRTAGCPPCGQTVSARGLQERTVETLVGAVRLRRPSVYGWPWQPGTTSVDEARQLTACRTPPDVQRAAVQLTQEIPYETACELFAERTGLPLRAHPAPEVTPAGAEGLTGLEVAPSRAESRAKIAAVAAGQPWRPILVLAMAGAEVPTRPETAQGRRAGRTPARAKRARWTGEGREATGVRCSLRADDRIVQVLSWPHVQTDEEAAEALRQGTAAGVIPEAEVRLGVIADGAPWIWTQAQALCPSAGEMLDHSHGRARLHQVAALQDGAPPERPREGCAAALARLVYGAGHGVIWGLQRRKATEATAAQEIATLIAYLPRPQERLD
jgi:hypothetical protein